MKRLPVFAAAAVLATTVAPQALATPPVHSRATLLSQESPLDPRKCSIQDAHRNYEKETSIVVNPTDPDHIVVAWLQDNLSGIVVATSHDGGATWSTVVPPGTSTCSGSNMGAALHPRLAFAPDGRTVYLVSHPHEVPYDQTAPDLRSAHNDIIVNTSPDGGLTWGQPESITGGQNVGSDMDTIAVEPDGSLDIVWSAPEALAGDPVYLTRKGPGGALNTTLVRKGPPGTLSFNTITALDGGRLVLFSTDWKWASTEDGPVYALTSDDKGATWTLRKELVANAVGTWSPAAVGPNGDLHFMYRTLADGEYTMWLVTSTDDGSSFSEPKKAFTYSAGDFALPMPTLAVGPDGTLVVLVHDYEDDRQDDDELTSSVRLRFSRDGGTTWSETRIGTPFDLKKVPWYDWNGGQAFGFYSEIAATPCGVVGAAPLAGANARLGPTDIFFIDVTGRFFTQGSCSQ